MSPAFRRIALAAMLCLLCTGARAQSGGSASYPSKPIHVLIAFSAGGLADIVSRLLTDPMSKSLGQTFVLENRPGAGGNLAMEAVARAEPDGYTLVMVGPGAAINGSLYKKLNYSPTRDLVPISTMAWGPFAMYVSGSLPVKNVAEFIAYAKARPGQLNYASVGVGSGGHFTAVLFTLAAGLDMVHVPYKGVQPAAPGLVSGQVHLMFNAFGPLNQFVQNGKIRLLGVTSPERVPQYPDVPAIAESLPGFDASGWYVLLAPVRTPHEVLIRLNAAMRAAYAEGEVSQRILRTGMQPKPQALDEAAQFLSAEAKKWGEAVKVSGATAD